MLACMKKRVGGACASKASPTGAWLTWASAPLSYHKFVAEFMRSAMFSQIWGQHRVTANRSGRCASQQWLPKRSGLLCAHGHVQESRTCAPRSANQSGFQLVIDCEIDLWQARWWASWTERVRQSRTASNGTGKRLQAAQKASNLYMQAMQYKHIKITSSQL